MASVIYNGYKIIPAPLVAITKEYTRFQNTEKLGVQFVITLTGKVLPCKGGLYTGSGYPADTSSTDKFEDVMKKLDALRHLFKEDGKTLEIQTDSGGTPLRCYPVVRSVTFPEGIWVDIADYTIVLETSCILGLNSDDDDSGLAQHLTEASEEWILELSDQPVADGIPHSFKLQHSISAAGISTYSSDPVQAPLPGITYAREWVQPKMGISNDILYGSGNFALSGTYLAYNHLLNETINEYAGRYSITETWLVSPSNYTEDFSVSTRNSIESSLIVVSIAGNLNGLETNNSSSVSTSKWVAVSGAWQGIKNSLYSRALSYSALSFLHPTPLSSTVGSNPVNGTITYNYEYNNRPTNYVTGALSESIDINDINGASIIAAIPIIGRTAGPILQDMNTISETVRTLSIDIVMPVYSGGIVVEDIMNAAPKIEVAALVNLFYTDLTSSYNQVYKTKDMESWSWKTGHYTRQVEWLYQNC